MVSFRTYSQPASHLQTILVSVFSTCNTYLTQFQYLQLCARKIKIVKKNGKIKLK